MEIKKYHHLSDQQKKKLLELWNKEYPAQLGYSDLPAFNAYLNKLIDAEHFLVEDKNGVIKGWYFHFTREGSKWFVIILASEIHGKGIGTALIQKAKENETELNGWVTDHDKYKKKNGAVYHSPIAFYKKNGFEVLMDQRLETEVLSAVKIVWKK